MSALPAKPGLRHSVSEWNSNNHQLSDTAEHERYVSNVIRQEGRSLRNETNCKTTWDESDTSRRLSDRIWDVARWKDTLEICAQKVDEEMEALTLSRANRAGARCTAVPLEVSSECLTLRDGRRGYELVTDPVHEQLRKEVELIERVQQVLQQHIDKAFEQLCSSTPQEWVQFSQYNVACAEEAMHLSQQIREDTSLTRAQLQNELDTQRRATEFALRKRNHHEEQARDELEWQIKNTEDEMAEMESDIHGLDADLQAKTASLKLAHTRLENRTNRPGMDLCRDEVQHGLVDEVHQLEATIMALKQKLSEAQHSLQKMKLHHSRMLQDLSRKQEALSLEQRSMNTRTRLKSPSCTDKTPVLLVPLTNSSGSNLQLLAQ
ncbi:Tektin-2 Tektin-t Testicular tektin [Larimichthys crocea]|uniref:Tektin n=1 Tax=Larimichthys crocea TaxID=215358 RepID=A0A6G0HTU4_LARCR|nr:Tektin-2 Tektin-t Testicular tektin [Larimichthys crocea]